MVFPICHISNTGFMRIFLILYVFLLFISSYAFGQHLPPDYIYNPHIRFVEIYQEGSNQTFPIWELNSNQTLKISFDDLNQETNRYAYEVIHCTYDWKPSDLVFMQYMQGFESYEIFDFKLSTNTTQSYTHYWFHFPNEYMRPTISGNYIIRVFDANDKENVIFTRRFWVVENRVSIDAKVRYASQVQLRNTHQELYFTIRSAGVTVQDAYNDLKVVIMQNNRWDNVKYDIPPQFVSPGQFSYQYTTGETAFPAGNQYRFLDLKTLMLIVEPVSKVMLDNGKYHILLRPEIIRTYTNFQMRPDINGRFAIYNQDNYGTSIDPDYAYVYFSVPAYEPFEEGDVYLTGGFTFGEMLPTYKMQYNANYQMYELVTQLKQGYYNYQYLIKPKGKKEGLTFPIEGDFAETENDYTIFVYIRQPGDITHKLLGISFINSMKDR